MMNPRRFVAVLSVSATLVLFQSTTAGADNCGTASDTCRGTFVGAGAAAAGAAALSLAVAGGAAYLLRGNRGKPEHWRDGKPKDE